MQDKGHYWYFLGNAIFVEIKLLICITIQLNRNDPKYHDFLDSPKAVLDNTNAFKVLMNWDTVFSLWCPCCSFRRFKTAGILKHFKDRTANKSRYFVACLRNFLWHQRSAMYRPRNFSKVVVYRRSCSHVIVVLQAHSKYIIVPIVFPWLNAQYLVCNHHIGFLISFGAPKWRPKKLNTKERSRTKSRQVVKMSYKAVLWT